MIMISQWYDENSLFLPSPWSRDLLWWKVEHCTETYTSSENANNVFLLIRKTYLNRIKQRAWYLNLITFQNKNQMGTSFLLNEVLFKK